MIETGACSYGSCSPPAEHRTPGMGWSCCSGTLRGYETLPAWSMASGRSPEQRDKRLVPDVVSVLRTYHLRITTCRESGHHTTAPGKRPIWCPRTAMAARRRRSASRRTWAGRQNGDPTGWPGTPAANGSWSPRFAGSSTRLPRAWRPAQCTGSCGAHIHISWEGSTCAAPGLALPVDTVKVFSVPSTDGTDPAVRP
jgi:hypothetical protein